MAVVSCTNTRVNAKNDSPGGRTKASVGIIKKRVTKKACISKLLLVSFSNMRVVLKLKVVLILKLLFVLGRNMLLQG